MGQVVQRYIATSRAEGRSDQPVRAPCMVKPNKKANKNTMNKTTSRIKPTTKFIIKSQKDSIPGGRMYPGLYHLKVISDSLLQIPITIFEQRRKRQDEQSSQKIV